MKLARYSLAGLASLALGVSACTTVTENSAPAQSSPPASPTHSSPGTSTTPQSGPSPQASPPPSSGTSPNVTDPWAVVSAYYGDIESGNYQQAWALIGSGATTGQTYQQFKDGFACTGSQTLSEVGESGDQVTFNLTATDSCNGQVQHFTGTDTVQNGKIVNANVSRTG
jgi:hypothetical protein